MAEKWWGDPKNREDVLKLIGNEKITDLLNEAYVYGDVNKVIELFSSIDNKEVMSKAALHYININYILSVLGPKEARASKLYADRVKDFAEDLDKLGVNTPEEVNELLPQIIELSKLNLYIFPQDIEGITDNIDEYLAREKTLREIRMFDKEDLVKKALDDLDVK